MFSPCMRFLATLSLTLGVVSTSSAEEYPNRPITLVVPFAAGGTTDLLGRRLAKDLSETLKQPMVVENRPGAGSMIGTGQVAKAAPNGYTLLLATGSSLAVAPAFTKTQYDPIRDFTPVSILVASPFAVVVGKEVPAKSVSDLIALAKSAPGKLNMASFGTGSASHLAGELFQSMAKVQMTHVPYKGSAPAMTELLGGRVDVMFDIVSAVLEQHKTGGIKILAVTGSKSAPALPEVPTVQEVIPGYEAVSWFGVVGPAGMPNDVVSKLNDAIVKSLKQPEFVSLMERQSLQPVGNTPEEFAKVIKEDLEKWTNVVKEANITP
jgi:Uncharacterized protein conserved in bacteria